MIFLFNFLYLTVVSSSSHEICFQRIETHNGLSQISVLAIYQDELGYMWFGTGEGLNRYDGKNIEVILSKEDEASGLSSNIINTIYGRGDNLYIHCGYHYLVSYNTRKDEFSQIDTKCSHIGQGKHGLWVSYGNALKYYDYSTQKIALYYTIPGYDEINSIFETSAGKLYVGTENALYFLDENKTLNRILADVAVSCIYEDSKQNIWVGTNGKGVYKINRTGQVDYYSKHSGEMASRLSDDIIRAFCEDNFGQIWIATFNGLNRMIPETGQVFVYKSAVGKPTELSHNSIYTLYKDRQGTIWIGTYFGGADYYNPEFNIYTYYYPEANNFGSVNFPIIGKMTEDKNNNLWICTEGGGLNFYDRERQTFQYHQATGGNSISHNNLKCIRYDAGSHKLYIGTHLGGLNIYDINGHTFKSFTTLTPQKLPNNVVEAIFPYNGKLIILTQKGIVQLDIASETIEPFFKDKQIEKKIGYNLTNIYIDTMHNLWLSLTEGGLLRYNLTSGSFQSYTHSFSNAGSIGRHPVSDIYETKDGLLLFATRGSGLYEYSPGTDSFTRYTVAENNLLSDFIYQITETNYGYILLLTNNGVNILNKDLSSQHHITDEKGFPLDKINFGCGMYVAQNGEIFVGGLHGMASFFENRIALAKKDYHLFFSDLCINNKLQKASDHPAIIPESLPYLKEITLKYNQTNILIRFATSNYINQNNIPYEYKLVGLDDHWLPVEDQNIRYSSLSPGKYTLHVREHLPENDRSHTPKEISLMIHVNPPFYASNIAFVLYFIAVCLALWWIIHSNKMKFKLKTSLEYEIRENDRIQELNQTKLQFFTNISHEFRTPLTLIIGQIESLLQVRNLQSSIHHRLTKVYKNAVHMRQLISELLDFRKQERDVLELKVSEMDVVEFAKNIFDFFKEPAIKKQIDYTFFSSESKILLWFDPVQMQKVLYNLLSNAFKYVDDKSAVMLKVEKRQSGTVSISVSDTGPGIAAEDLPRIFDRFYQAKNTSSAGHQGTGIGLALSKGIVDLHHGTICVQNNPDRGCTFKVELPTGSGHFTEEEKTPDDAFVKNLHQESEILRRSYPEIQETMATEEISTLSTILIVDDNEEVLEFLCEIFSQIYHVETANDGFEALEKVKTLQPDIVLCDIMMPRLSGKEVCIKIKSNFETSHIPVILITADASDEQNMEGLMAGADDYIVKPFNIKFLISRCNNLVISRKRLQERYSKQVEDAPVPLATNKQDQELLSRAMDVVERYIDDPTFNVNVFASEMALGRSNLYFKIKGITGMTPNDFILNIRLKKAASLLLSEPDLNISDITYRLGFGSPRYFSKCFKDLFGAPPLNYRKAKGK